MESPKDQLIELYYQRVQAMTEKINQLQNQLNYYRYKLQCIDAGHLF